MLAQGQPLGCCMAVPGMLHRWDGRCWCFLTPWGIVEGSGSQSELARLMVWVEAMGGGQSAVRVPRATSLVDDKLFELIGLMLVFLSCC